MKRSIKVCCWLLSPEDGSEERSWWLLNLIKGIFWYCLALIIGLLIAQLH